MGCTDVMPVRLDATLSCRAAMGLHIACMLLCIAGTMVHYTLYVMCSCHIYVFVCRTRDGSQLLQPLTNGSPRIAASWRCHAQILRNYNVANFYCHHHFESLAASGQTQELLSMLCVSCWSELAVF